MGAAAREQSSRNAMNICLHLFEVFRGNDGAFGEELLDSHRPETVHPIPRQMPREVPVNDRIVGGDDESSWWIPKLWKVLECQPSGPLEVTGPPWNRSEAGTLGSDWDRPRHQVPDVSVNVREHHVLRGRVPLTQRFAERAAIAGPVHYHAGSGGAS